MATRMYFDIRHLHQSNFFLACFPPPSLSPVKTGTLWPMQPKNHGCSMPLLRKISHLEVLSTNKGKAKRFMMILILTKAV